MRKAAKGAAKTRKTEHQRQVEEFHRLAEEAAEIRAANRAVREELRDNPGKQEKVRKALIDDLLRVYNHPCNPFRGFAASRKRYRQLGRYPEVLVEDFFGNHAEFQRAAGLRDSRSETRGRNLSAKLHTEQQIAKFARANVTRYHGRFDRLKGKRGHIEGLVASDLHSMHCDPFAREVFLAECKLRQPDAIVFNGDVVDFPAVSTHPKLPGHFHLSMQDELNWAKALFRQTREECPEAAIYYVIGNHEYRLVRYLADTKPSLASLDSLDFSELFGLAEFEVCFVCRSNFLAPTSKMRREDVAENWIILGDCYAITHGNSCAKFSAEKELATFKMSGTSGHVHRPQLYYDNSPGTGPLSWMSTPMMAHESDGRDFIHGPSRWNMGFGEFAIFPQARAVSQNIVLVHHDVAIVNGTVYRPTKAVLEARKAMSEVRSKP